MIRYIKYQISIFFTICFLLIHVAGNCADPVFIVNTIDDPDQTLCESNPAKCKGTLRWAIISANREPRSKIQFKIPGKGPHIIKLKSELPVIRRTVELDGTTQHGYIEEEAPVVIILAKEFTGKYTLSIGSLKEYEGEASNSIIKGLGIASYYNDGIVVIRTDSITIEKNHFQELGLSTKSSIKFYVSKDCKVHNNYLTTKNVGYGINLYESEVIITQNEILNYEKGIISQNSSVIIHGNSIGTLNPIFSSNAIGIDISLKKGSRFIIGGTSEYLRNYIFGNDIGISVTNPSQPGDAVIQGNSIGSTKSELRFNRVGIILHNATYCFIGGDEVFKGNKFYGKTGVIVESEGGQSAVKNRINKNYFYTFLPDFNKQIELNYGTVNEGNNGKSPPGFNAHHIGSDITFSGTALPNDYIEIYGLSNSNQEAKFMGFTNASSFGQWTINMVAPASQPIGTWYGATATDLAGNTSEFAYTKSYCSTRDILVEFDVSECSGLNVQFIYNTSLAQVNDQYKLEIKQPVGPYVLVNTQVYNGSAPLTYDHSFTNYGNYTTRLTLILPDNCEYEYVREVRVGPESIGNIEQSGNCIGEIIFSIPSTITGSYTWNCINQSNLSIVSTYSGSGSIQDFPVEIVFPGQYEIELSFYDPASQCTYNLTRIVEIAPLPNLNIENIQSASCRDAEDGSISFSQEQGKITVTNLSGGFERTQVDNGIFTDLDPGDYVADRELNGCVSERVLFTIEFVEPVINVCVDLIPCSGTTDLTFHINATRIQPNTLGTYEFIIVDEATSATLTNGTGTFGTTMQTQVPGVATGKQYRIELLPSPGTVPNINHCAVTKTITLDPPVLQLSLEGTGSIFPPCDEQNDPTDITVNCALQRNICGIIHSSEFSYQLKQKNSDGTVTNVGPPILKPEESHTFVDVPPGEYTVEVSLIPLGLNCFDTISFIVESPESFQAELLVANTTCAESNDGSARVKVQGGIGDIYYKWYQDDESESVLSNTSRVTGLIPGIEYVVTIRDENPCTNSIKSFTFSIDDVTALEQPVINIDDCEISAAIEDDGTGPYTFIWTRITEEAINKTTETGEITEDGEPIEHLSLENYKQEVILATDQDINPVGGASTSVLNILTDTEDLKSGEYYVLVINSNGCQVMSEIADYEIPSFTRTYDIYIRWSTPVFEEQEEPPIADPTVHSIVLEATHFAQDIQNQTASCIADAVAELTENYINLCYTTEFLNDSLKLSYSINQEQSTLYYFDRADNLVRTVPPLGVDETGVDRQILPFRHLLSTKYSYNSLGQLIEQSTPDGGITHFLYNDQNQLRFSQDARQKDPGENDPDSEKYSYTKYDKLGRITEVGESYLVGADFNTELDNPIYLQDQPDFPELNTSQESYTFYNWPEQGIQNEGKGQRFLRNRISYTWTHNLNGDSIFTYYSYDPHGNVEWLVQEIQGIFKNYLGYEYDLISGNVLKVKYNKGRPDQFFHEYEYDEENRLLEVKTSTNGVIWDHDARYQYYDHGPLRSLELGHNRIQKLDYTYTIEGWLKGINTPQLSHTSEEEDNNFSRDVFGITLGYFPGDFQRTGSPFNTDQPESLFGNPQYNGNISSLTSKNSFDNSQDPFNHLLSGQVFNYDELYRLRNSILSSYNSLNEDYQQLEDYSSQYTYDANGNIISLERKGNSQKGLDLDELSYTYYPNTNRLSKVEDAILTDNYENDLSSGQINNNYEYDATGNLTRDHQEGIQFKWNAYGKVSEVIPDNSDDPISQKPWIRFSYDATGNRVKKEINSTPYDNDGNPQWLPETIKTTFYIPDASGNVNAIYEKSSESNQGYAPYNSHFLFSTLLFPSSYESSQNASLTFEEPIIFSYPSSIQVIEGNAGNELVWLTYYNAGVVKRIYFKGGSEDEHPTSPEYIAKGLFYHHTTDLVYIQEITAHSLDEIDIISRPGDLIEADHFEFVLAGGDEWSPQGEENPGNHTTAVLQLTEYIENEFWLSSITLKEQPIYGIERLGQYLADSLIIRYATLIDEGNLSPTDIDRYVRVTELKHWLTAFEESHSFNLNSINESITSVQLKDAYEWNDRIASNANFNGSLGNAVAVVEDNDSDLFCYILSAEKYWGHSDVNLVFDRYGYLIPGSDGIIADPHSKPVVAHFQHESESFGYFLFTKGIDGRIYLHIVDESDGNFEQSGKIIYKNIPLDDDPDNANYGNGMAVVEDQVNQRILLFATRYIPPAGSDVLGTLELVSFTISLPDFFNDAQVHATIPAIDPDGLTDVQISPDGKKLSLIDYRQNLGWFDQREAEVLIFDLDENFDLSTDYQAIDLINGTDPQYTSFDFSANNEQIILNQSPISPQVHNLQIDIGRDQNRVIDLNRSGTLLRGQEGKIFLVEHENKVIDQYNSGNFMTWLDDQYQFTNNGLGTGILPNQPHKIVNSSYVDQIFARSVDKKIYELKDHLGNIRTIVSDVKNPIDQSVRIKSYYNYYPFGMAMPDRNFQEKNYRYGFNGMEKDDEIGGKGNSYTTLYRHYDPRIGRWRSIDPKFQKYLSVSPYVLSFNNPIYFLDEDGDDPDSNDDESDAWMFLSGVAHGATKVFLQIGGLLHVAIGTESWSDYQQTLKEWDEAGEPYSEYSKEVGENTGLLLSTYGAGGKGPKGEPGVQFLYGKKPILRHPNGKPIRGSGWRGNKNPNAKSKGYDIPIKKTGYPNFSKYLYKGTKGKNTVKIKLTGNRASDYAAATKKAGFKSKPKDYTWHHTEKVTKKGSEITGEMQLVKTGAHRSAGHSGGVSKARKLSGNKNWY